MELIVGEMEGKELSTVVARRKIMRENRIWISESKYLHQSDQNAADSNKFYYPSDVRNISVVCVSSCRIVEAISAESSIWNCACITGISLIGHDIDML